MEDEDEYFEKDNVILVIISKCTNKRFQRTFRTVRAHKKTVTLIKLTGQKALQVYFLTVQTSSNSNHYLKSKKSLYKLLHVCMF